MNNGITKYTKAVFAFTKKHRSEILKGFGIVGMQTASIMAITVTPKAYCKLHEAELDAGIDRSAGQRLPFKDVVKTIWKYYLPSVLLDGMSIGCLICAGTEDSKKNAAMATAYALSESALKDYQDKMVEVVGPNKAEAVRDAVAKKQIEERPVTKSEVIVTDKGSTLFYDPYSGRYFETDIDNVKKAIVAVNMQMINEGYTSLNDLYYEIDAKNLGPTTTGDHLAWRVENGSFDIRMSAQVADDGRPCLVLDYTVAPKYDVNGW